MFVGFWSWIIDIVKLHISVKECTGKSNDDKIKFWKETLQQFKISQEKFTVFVGDSAEKSFSEIISNFKYFEEKLVWCEKIVWWSERELEVWDWNFAMLSQWFFDQLKNRYARLCSTLEKPGPVYLL